MRWQLRTRAAARASGVLGALLATCFAACSVDTTAPTLPPSAGAPASNASGMAGMPAATGGSGGVTQAGTAGAAGASGGSAGVANGGGAGTPSTAGNAGTATAGSGGQAGASGAGGTGGGVGIAPGAELNGESWTMKCSKPDSDPGAGDRCWLLPPGQNACPAAGYTSLDKTLHFGGTPGTIYQVTLHFEGTHEAGDYSGGTKLSNEFLKGATHASGGLHTWLSMEVSSPAAVYNPNAGGNGGMVRTYDYKVTIPIEGGATVRLKASDIDCLMHRYCQNNVLNPCKGYVLAGISPADAPIDGSFLRMTVESAIAM